MLPFEESAITMLVQFHDVAPFSCWGISTVLNRPLPS
jgi:hypothetical protein